MSQEQVPSIDVCASAELQEGEKEMAAPVLEDVDLAALALHVEVVGELALEAFGALAMPEVLAHHRLGIHACAVVTSVSSMTARMSHRLG